MHTYIPIILFITIYYTCIDQDIGVIRPQSRESNCIRFSHESMFGEKTKQNQTLERHP